MPQRIMNNRIRGGLIKHLSQYVTRNKIDKINEMLKYRTNYVTLILEDIYKPHNAGATIRTCECLGVQNIHIIENTSLFTVSHDVTQGSYKWVTLHRYNEKNRNNTETCIRTLKSEGYRIIATTPNTNIDNQTLEEISLDTKLAFMFGNEEEGLSDYSLKAADAYLKLPMHGFTRSYNISVSVAITLSYIIDKLHKSNVPWQLTRTEKNELTLAWYKKNIRRSDLIEKAFLEQQDT
jgi:tRNA (guanosine-2'-O-)-methyltransferase